jgi:hypothetical protein
MPSKKTTARSTVPVKPGAAQQSATATRRTPEVDQTQVRQERAQKFLRAERLRQAELEAQGYCF